MSHPWMGVTYSYDNMSNMPHAWISWVWRVVNILLRCSVDVVCWWCIAWTFCVDVLCCFTVWDCTLLIPCGHIVLMYGVDVWFWYTVCHIVLIYSVQYYIITNTVWTYCVDVWCWCILLIYCVTSCVDTQREILHY